MTPYEEICRTFKMKLSGDESFVDFATRASDRINKCTDVQWKGLSEEVQVWVNETLKVREDNKQVGAGEEPADLPALEGFPDPNSADDAIDDEAPTDDENSDGSTAEAEEALSNEVSDESSAEGVDESPDEAQDVAETSSASGRRAPVARRRPVTVPARSVKKDTKKGKDKAVVSKVRTPAGARAGRRSTIDENAKIKILVKENPHRKGTKLYNYFNKYKPGMTVAQVTKHVPLRNVAYLEQLGHIKVG